MWTARGGRGALARNGCHGAAGLLTLALSSFLGPSASAAAGCRAAWLAPAALILTGGSPGANDFTIAAITVVVITAVAIIPLLPWHVLAVGLAIELRLHSLVPMGIFIQFRP